ncbi:MAG: hypothetical protein NC207_07335 [Bacteroides sp.]|nr:hypothetical protein [Bacteroides sp.]
MKNLLFYYPQHFNRTKEGTNPFFDKLLEVCDRNGISYDVMEEPDRGTDKPRNAKATKADSFFWTVTIIRKILSLVLPKMDFFQREKFVARIFNFLTLGRYRYRNYITISGSMYHLFANLNSKAQVYDMQHGILDKQHPTFFKDGHLLPQFFRRNLHFILWGKGYNDDFTKGDETVLNGRTHVMGYPMPLVEECCQISENRSIIVSLQFTESIEGDEREKDKRKLQEFLEDTKDSDYRILLKHHPRFNNCIDIDDLLDKYSHAEITAKPLAELAKEVRLHVTYFSTTAFEFAAFGIPTYFMPYSNRPARYALFYSEYDYPLFKGMDISTVLSLVDDEKSRKQCAETVRLWYKRFYSPFNEAAFLELIK